MRKKKTTKRTNTPKKPPANSTVNKVIDTKSEKEKATNERKQDNSNNQYADNIMNTQKEKTEKNMRRWTRVSIVFNIAITVATIIIIWFNVEAMKATVKSADIADSTFTEVKKQFEILNRPILQIADIALAKFKAGETAAIIYKLENLGNYAAKVLRRSVSLGYVKDTSERPNKVQTNIDIPTYITKESPFTENLFFANDIITPDYYNAVINGTLKTLVVGEIEYINEVTKESWFTKFVIYIHPPPSKDFQIITMDNIRK